MTVEGTLDDTGSALLRDETNGVPAGRLALDLSGLVHVDDTGLAFLRALADRGAGIFGASRYVQLLLQATPPEPAPSTRSGPPAPSSRLSDTEEPE